LGRNKNLGNETCPDPRCIGFQELGRFRTKIARGKRTARYIDRLYFRHNDGEIPEHYVDNFVSQRNEHADIFAKMGHTIYQIGEHVKSFPLQADEITRLNFALRCFMVDIIEPRRHVAWLERMKKVWGLVGTQLPGDTVDGWNELVEEFKTYEKDVQKMAALKERWSTTPIRRDLNEILRTAPLFREINNLYNKYEFPKRRTKRLNENLSENYGKNGGLYAGRKTDDYTGIETPTTT
jgi:hypothetical protein